VIAYESADGRARLYQGDSRDLSRIPTASVGVILTSPTYWVSDRGRAAADRYARSLAVGFGREWRRVLDTNLTSAFLMSRAVYPVMKGQGGGKIINIGSMMSIFGAGFAPAYAASKGGIVQFTKATASAWARDNIQVNAVLPGWIDTDLTAAARREVPGLNENVLARTPAGRWGVSEDMAGIAVFLASPASDFVTGTAIPVDGGYSIQG